MKPLLQEIAGYYIDRHAGEITNYCFVFPNKRAGVFFNHFLALAAEEAGMPLIHPEVLTISDFVADVTECVEASRIEQLFILYRCYRDVMNRHVAGDGEPNSVDFNKFQFWGDVLLSDFTDVDKYLVNPAELFHNIEALREISSNYLTLEQIEVIKRYWGDEKAPRQVAEFWNHAVHVSDTGEHGARRATAPFIKLWQVMNELYVAFNEELDRRGLAYQGMVYRRALEMIKSMPADEFPYDRYVFIGFNVLSTVEEEIFESMRAKGLAQFFWDYASPAFAEGDNRATRFLKQYVKDFPQPDDAREIGTVLSEWPLVEVIGVPSVNGQTKIVSDIVAKLLPDGGNDRTLLSTAIVLPDENLCLPVINSLPDSIADINVTMGFPLRNTPVASLMSSILSMQLRARRLRYENTFFRDDVVAVLSHPLVRSISSELCDRISKIISQKRLFNVPRSLLMSPEYARLHPLFDLADDAMSSREVFAFLRRLTLWLLDEVNVKYAVVAEAGDDADEPAEDEMPEVTLTAAGAIEAGFLKHYLNALDELQRLQRRHLDDLNVDLSDSTIFHMVERITGGESVSFEGRPLKGLQVMGILETRAIDFDNVIITSMNERIFPRKHFSKSFIPPALRRGYGMATIEHQESISAYYFYRLISRAKRVFLLYDSRTQGTKSGEPSRYINQLRYLYRPQGLKVSTAFYNLQVDDSHLVSLSLDAARRAKLRSYIDTVNPHYISATSINNYINCPMQFALSYLEGYFDNDDVKDFFDEATFGSVLHQVVERLYSSQQVDGRPVVIDKAVIHKLKHSGVIEPEIKRAINELYLGRDADDSAPLTGDAELIAKMMHDMVQNMLSHELDYYDSFTFISGEIKQKVRLRISDRLSINFSYTIDRVDSVTAPDGRKVIRIIDYKTGADEVSSTLDLLFTPTKSKSRNKAILQLFLYCNAFVQNAKGLDDDTLVQPMIYRFRTIGRNLPPQPLTIDSRVVTDYRMFNDEIMARLDEILYPLFNTEGDVPVVFDCAEDEHACKYCKFTSICMK